VSAFSDYENIDVLHHTLMVAVTTSAPAELRGDKLEDAVDGVGVVVHAQLVRDGQEQGVGGGDGLVHGELLDQHVGFGGV
jgi:hypothetical protein